MLEIEPQLIERYIRTGQVRLVVRHLLQLGEKSLVLAEASECAADQDRFWEMRSALYRRLDQLYVDTRANIERTAADLGLDLVVFNACLDQQTHREAVRADFAAAENEGVRSRPVFQIGERVLVGSRSFAAFEEAFEAAAGR